jgi:hypothetical protein
MFYPHKFPPSVAALSTDHSPTVTPALLRPTPLRRVVFLLLRSLSPGYNWSKRMDGWNDTGGRVSR